MFTFKKTALALALSVAATGAHAVAVIGMTLADTINAATASVGTDTRSGAFKFTPILSGVNNSVYAAGTSFFTGNVNGGVINLAGASANSLNPANAFTTGFTFAGSNFGPDTIGPIVADITGGVLTVSSLPWGGYFSGASFQFNLPPDAGTLVVDNLISIGGGSYDYRMHWSHVITAADDPSGTYVGFNANWVIEGTMTTAVPEASTYGMMMAGLGLVGVAARRRRAAKRKPE
jgi:hypothetical protein